MNPEHVRVLVARRMQHNAQEYGHNEATQQDLLCYPVGPYANG